MNPFEKAARSLDLTHTAPTKKAFHGGETSRLFRDWTAGNLSPDKESAPFRRIMRARARSLVRDNPYAAGFVAELANNVVGPNGIKLRAGIVTRNGEEHKGVNDTIEAAFEEWGFPENASADEHDSWIDLQKLIIQTVAVDGECLVRRLKYFDNAHGFAIQILDADQLDDFYNVKPGGEGGNEIRGGIELNEHGRAVAYHLWAHHPTDNLKRTRVRVAAEEITHLFVRYRPNQTRGMTWFAPVLTSLKMHDGYTEAELVAARTAAAKMGFIVTKNPEMGGGSFSVDADPEKERIMDASPGTFDELEPGQELQLFDPQHPTAGFKDFAKVILRGIARGLGMSYTALTGDLESVNYSSIRTGMLAERDNWRWIQRWMYTQLHRRVYRDWVKMALLTEALRVDSRIAGDYAAVSWKPRGWGWIDPKKDLEARILGIQWGMDSRTEALDEEGGDLEETYSNLAREQKLAEEYEIDVVVESPGTPGASTGDPAAADTQQSGADDAQNDANPDARTTLRKVV